MSQGGGQADGPVDPNDPEQVAQYISRYLRNKVLPVRPTPGKSSDCFTRSTPLISLLLNSWWLLIRTKPSTVLKMSSLCSYASHIPEIRTVLSGC